MTLWRRVSYSRWRAARAPSASLGRSWADATLFVFFTKTGSYWQTLETFWLELGQAPFSLFVCRRLQKGALISEPILIPTGDPPRTIWNHMGAFWVPCWDPQVFVLRPAQNEHLPRVILTSHWTTRMLAGIRSTGERSDGWMIGHMVC